MISRRRIPATGLMLAALALGGAAQLAACGDDDSATEARIERERREAARIARQEEKIKQLEREAREARKERNRNRNKSDGSSGGSGSSGSSGALSKECGGSVSANNVTSCPFAQEVRNAYFRDIGSGGGTVSAYSSARSQYFDMSCTGGSPHSCTGGQGAEVRFP
jgi:hypothetical protein